MTLATSDPPIAAPSRSFAAQYKLRPGQADEMVEGDGSLHPHWRMFVSMLDDLGPEELPRRWEQARRLIGENGITHNVYGDPNGLDRPWNLDMVPLLVPAAQWRDISDSLIQRATLLDLLMADLYGPARSISEGWLPAELLHNNPGFLRSLHGVTLPKGQWLHLYGADVVRTESGQFQVLSDRTQAPSGAGYSLENRIVINGILPAVFKQCNVHRLAPFFIAMRKALAALAPSNRENPRVVLLTPGPYNETYFEHAYLARYLGYTLAQGNDLTVRDGRVFLKTLGGLQRVDVILRRVDDHYCDPLELFQHSFLGVPGLVQAVREGNVAIANALGTGVLQTPAFLPFLPELCRRLLGQELKIPSVQTWWCGDGQSLPYVLDNLTKLVIKPAYPAPGSDPQFGEKLTRAELDELAGRLRARPGDYVAQEPVNSGTAPVLVDDHLEPRRFVIRAFLTAANDSYTVMQGALTRVPGSPDERVVSLQKGGGSKDTWILADEPVTEATLLATASQPVELNRGGSDLPSRIADDLFWLGRYIQRAEGDVRIARCLFGRLMDQGRGDGTETAAILAAALLGHSRFRMEEAGIPGLVKEVFGTAGSGGLRSSVSHVQGLVRALRDRVSGDAWRILQGTDRDLGDFDLKVDDNQTADAVHVLNRLAVGFLAFSGVVAESMTRGQAWHFLDLGSRIERAMVMGRLLQSTLVRSGKSDPGVLDGLLEIADSSLTYRRRYFTQLDCSAVVDLLLADESNPRAIAYQIAAIDQHLACLPNEAKHPHRSPHTQLITRLRTDLKLADLRPACVADDKGIRTGLQKLLAQVVDGLEDIAELVSQIYFSHAAVSRRLSGPGEEGSR